MGTRFSEWQVPGPNVWGQVMISLQMEIRPLFNLGLYLKLYLKTGVGACNITFTIIQKSSLCQKNIILAELWVLMDPFCSARFHHRISNYSHAWVKVLRNRKQAAKLKSKTILNIEKRFLFRHWSVNDYYVSVEFTSNRRLLRLSSIKQPSCTGGFTWEWRQRTRANLRM